MVERCDALASTAVSATHPLHEVFVSELLPLLEACRFLEKKAAALLKPRSLGAEGRPWWLWGLESRIHREPFGVIGVIAPSNYPLLLGGVQTLQALVAGNAVVWKPAKGGSNAVRVFQELLFSAGMPVDLLIVLPDTVEAGVLLSSAEIDKLVFTGCFENGVKVLEALSRNAVPAIVELSGSDPVFVREDADVSLVAKALRFGLQLNQGRTCMAPRRVYVPFGRVSELEKSIKEALAEVDLSQFARSDTITPPALQECLNDALEKGAYFVHGGVHSDRTVYPCVIGGVSADAQILQKDFFLPMLCIVPVESDAEALSQAARNRYALGASIFSRDLEKAVAMGAHIRAGLVSLNDVIVPSADPRVPFGGTGHSGYGVTRGAEGLLSLTRIKVLQIRKGGSLAHLDSKALDPSVIASVLTVAHGRNLAKRFTGLWSLIRQGASQWMRRKNT
jgi:acyl-CoA reductase-like NAD-dependent aldehyde dehydrogenase